MLVIAATCFVSCGKKSDPKPEKYVLSKTSLTTKYDEYYKFVITQGSLTIDPSNIKFTSSNPKTGTIGLEGLFDAKRVGDTKITAVIGETTLTADVTVTPYSTLCTEPILSFGALISDVKSKETRVLSSQNLEELVYAGENSKIRHVMYLFESGRLEASVLLLADNNLIVEESVKFLSERYTYLGKTNNNVYVFENENATVGLSYNTDLGYNAIFIKPDNKGASNIATIEKMYLKKLESINNMGNSLIK